MPGVIWAQTTASPKASSPKPSPRAAARGQASPGAANKKTGATEKGGNADAKKGPDVLGGDDSKGPTEITAKDEVQFDGTARTAIFVGNVKVIDPQFTMTTDKLTVWMNKQEDGGGIKEAHAEGNVIIVHANPQKNNQAEGGASPQTTPVANSAVFPQASASASASPGASPQVVLDTGRSQNAIYNAKQDAVTLIGWPQVTQGVNTHISTEEGTRMILYRDGRLQTFGPSRTVIQDKSSMKSPSPSPSPGETVVDPNKAQKNNVVH